MFAELLNGRTIKLIRFEIMKSINANGQQHALAALTRSVSIGLMFLVSPATALGMT
jgi:hypothetical protein